jgi:hypothetical protein
MWATEVQKVDIETLPKFEEKELFRTFMEDFNTGTLPHKKYYNLDLYEQRRAEKAAKKGRPQVRLCVCVYMHMNSSVVVWPCIYYSCVRACVRTSVLLWRCVCVCVPGY